MEWWLARQWSRIGRKAYIEHALYRCVVHGYRLLQYCGVSLTRGVEFGWHVLAKESSEEVVGRQGGHPDTSVRSRAADMGQHHASANRQHFV